MGDKRDLVAEMVEAELLAEQELANQRPTSPPKETFARVAIAEEASLPDPTKAKKERPRRIVEQVAAKNDPRREESEPPSAPHSAPPSSSSSDPHRAVTKPPPPGYGGGQTE